MTSINAPSPDGRDGSMQAVAGPSSSNPTAIKALTSTTAPSSNAFKPGGGEGSAFASGSSGPSLPPVSLPSGGGAIRGMDENITMNAVQGTASFSIPLPLSKSRQGSEPKMALQYDSGGGGSVWGMGWNLTGMVDVTRQTRTGLPRYGDGEQEDVFVLSGAEDLVPVYLRDKNGNLVSKVGSGSRAGEDDVGYELDEKFHDGFVVRQYRPRIEGLYSRVERWTDQLDPEDVHWRIISGKNEMMILGRDANSRIMSMDSSRTMIFSWLCCEWYDCFGNAKLYEYKKENSDGVNLRQANERNRTDDVRGSQRHLKRIKYGNRTPIADRTVASSAAAQLAATDWMFELVFDYGEHDWKNPTAQETKGQLWACRKDPFSSFKSGFEIRTYRLCKRVLMFHHFLDELGLQDYLVKALELQYQEGPAITYLQSVQQAGFVLRTSSDPPPADADKGSPYFIKRLPPLGLEYIQLPTEEEMRKLSFQDLGDDAGLDNVPEGVQSSYQWLDLLGEGLNGIFFAESDGEWYYKRNLSAANESAPVEGKADSFALGPMETRKPRFGPMERVAIRPSLRSSGRGPQFLDLEGDGRLDLAITEGNSPGFYRKTADPAMVPSSTQNVWEQFQPFNSWPAINMSNPNLRFIDITGDGKVDILISQDDVFVWYEGLGEGGFADGSRVPLGLDEDTSPRVLFSDPTESIHLADFSGDGMVDIVRIRNGDICYWPNMGYGRFGARVVMDNAPFFDKSEAFSFQRMVLGDIDGSGTTDIIYFCDEGASIYYNLAGNAWSEPLNISSLVPMFDSLTSVAAVDLLGSGTMCLVWSSSHPPQGRSIRYIDLSGGQKPHLLSKVTSNMGTETHFIYRPSTAYYLNDLAAGTPWATRLPHTQQCIDRIITYDCVSRVSFSKRYSYHHGYFDSVEREFRGFGMVEQWDTEQFESLNAPTDAVNQAKESYAPPAHTKSWFHTGAFVDHEMLSRAYAKEYFGTPDPKASNYDVAFEKFFNQQLRDQLPLDVASLSNNERREASRAFKGALLRTEIYGDDGSKKSGTPYQIIDIGNSVRMLQSKGKINKHAVFQTFTREKVTEHLERNTEDPRIQHSLTLDIDVFGNVLESADVCYGRKPSKIPQPDLEDRDKKLQAELKVTYSQNNFTNAVLETNDYRVPQPSRARKWEVSNFVPTDTPGGMFTPAEFVLVKKFAEITFDQSPDSTVPQKRLLERVETQYRRDDLSGLLDMDIQESLSLPGINYRLCFTSTMLKVFQRDGENLLVGADTVLPKEGGYVDREGNGNWWITSPQTFYDRNLTASAKEELLTAKAHFFTPQREQDAFGANTFMRSDPHDLSCAEIEDQVGNITIGQMDYRTLQHYIVTDVNGNRTQAILDALGIVVGMAIMGKENELLGDTLEGFRTNLTEEEVAVYFKNPSDTATILLAGATSRFIYDADSYRRNGAKSPIWASSIIRETHYHDQLPPTSDVAIEKVRTQIFVSYVDGFHREIQAKAQAESSTSTPMTPRWRGTGWTVFNNKGLPVQQFEPFFDDTHAFRFDRREGVSSKLLYDATSRPVGVILPNGTWSKEVNSAWNTSNWDVNDTATNNLFDDEDLSNIVKFLSKDGLDMSWFGARINGQKGVQEQVAATKTKAHANTPAFTYLDCLGRVILALKDNGQDGKISTRAKYDISGNVLEIRDGLDRVITTKQYNMSRQTLCTQSADSGSRWQLANVHGNQMRQWDSRGFQIRTEYDVLRRPINTYSQRTGNEKEALVFKNVYGEEQSDSQARNLRGKLFRKFDQAGMLTHPEWDFRGNQLLEERQFAQEYKTVLDWVDPSTVVLENEIYSTRRTFDALGRVITVKSPDQTVVTNTYNKGGLLQSVVSNLKGSTEATQFVASSEYDAYGRVIVHIAGNNTTTKKTFDSITQRLTNHTVIHQQGNSSTKIQDLSYTYDPIGNVMFVQNAAEQTVFFRNGAVSPDSEYTYDAIYRLTESKGREHVGQTKGAPTGPGLLSTLSPLAGASSSPVAPGDGSAMVRYDELYVYDAANCITTISHQLADPQFSGWTRRFSYETTAQDERKSNRLMLTIVGKVMENYAYDANGNMTSMPHLSKVRWTCTNQLRSSSQQILADGIPETTWYVYDGSGLRVRKVTERQSQPATATNALSSTTTTTMTTKMQERLIVDGLDIYRQYNGDGKTITQQCETLYISGVEARVAIVEDWSGGTNEKDSFKFRLMRFQLQDHLNSVSLELDEFGSVLSYEEYMPYGSTAYQLPSSKAPKRFRFASKERDSENGFYYFGQRYYMPWLLRWLNPDPIGISDGLNMYEYVASNPMRYIDPSGTCKESQSKKRPAESSPVRGDSDDELQHTSTRQRTEGPPTPPATPPATSQQALESSGGGGSTLDLTNFQIPSHWTFDEGFGDDFDFTGERTPPHSGEDSPERAQSPIYHEPGISTALALDAFQRASALVNGTHPDQFIAIGGLAVLLHGGRDQIHDVDVAATDDAWNAFTTAIAGGTVQGFAYAGIGSKPTYTSGLGTVEFDWVPIGGNMVPQVLKVNDITGGGVYAALGDMIVFKTTAAANYNNLPGSRDVAHYQNDLRDLEFLQGKRQEREAQGRGLDQRYYDDHDINGTLTRDVDWVLSQGRGGGFI